MKKILSKLLFAVVIVQVILSGEAFASLPDDLNKVDRLRTVLIQFSIIEKEKAYNKFTNDMFIGGLNNIISDGGANSELFVRQYEIIPSKDKYKKDAPITYDDALKCSLFALGYKNFMNEDYISTAASLGLLKNIEYDGSGTLTNVDGIQLLYNVMNTRPMIADYNGRFSVSQRVAIEEYRKIYEITGKVTATTRTSLNTEKGVSVGSIQINDQNYECTFAYDNNLLGKNIKGYIDTVSQEILYVYEDSNKNKEMEILDEDIISINADLTQIEYESGDKRKQAILADNSVVIYNGKLFSGHLTSDDLWVKNGKIRLLDNDNNNKYDVVFVEEYETLVVESVIPNNLEITGAVRTDQSLNYIKLEEDKYSIHKGDNIISLSEISKNNVLLVLRDRSSDPYYEIYVSDQVIEGEVTGMRDEEIKIDDTYYKPSAFFKEYLDYKHINVEIGSTVTAYLDTNGKLAYFEQTGDFEYYLYFGADYSDDEREYVIEYMTTKGEWETATLTKKTLLNGIVFSDKAGVYNQIRDLNPQVFKMKISADGKVKKIETADSSTGYVEDAFTKTQFYSEYVSDRGAFKNLYRIEKKGAVLFLLPNKESEKYNKDEYEAVSPSGYLNEHGTFNITAYDIDEFNYSRIFTMIRPSNLDGFLGSTLCVVRNAGAALDENGDRVSCIEVSVGTRESIWLYAKSGTVIEAQKGDIGRVYINGDGKIESFKRITGNESVTVGFGGLNIKGKVVKIREEKLLVESNGVRIPLEIHPSATAKIYYEGANVVEFCNCQVLSEGDEVACRISDGKLYDIVIIK